MEGGRELPEIPDLKRGFPGCMYTCLQRGWDWREEGWWLCDGVRYPRRQRKKNQAYSWKGEPWQGEKTPITHRGGNVDGHSGSGGQDWEGSSQFPLVPVKETTRLPVGRKRLVIEERLWGFGRGQVQINQKRRKAIQGWREGPCSRTQWSS